MSWRSFGPTALVVAVLSFGSAFAQQPAQPPSVPAYTIVEIEITDPQLFVQLGQQLGPLIAAAGGRSLTLATSPQVLHEGAAPKGIGIILWPSVEVATAFYTSAQFLNLIPLRDRAANLVRLVTIAGLPPPAQP
jgi:uncharacterized protein (DUF1330 family)